MPSKSPAKKPVATAAPKVALLNVGNVVGRPESLLLLKWGRNETAKGLFIVNERTVRELTANQELLRRPRVKGDFEHASVSERPEDHPMRFGSEGTPVAVPQVGLLAVGVTWTPQGIEFVPDHYSDLSAAPIYDERTREVIGLHSYAHCRHGAADGATIEDSLATALTALNASLAVLSNTPTQNPPMDPLMKRTELLCSLFAAAGVECPENPTDEQLVAATAALMPRLSAAPVPPPGDAAMAALRAEIATLNASVSAIAAESQKAAKLKPFEAMLEVALASGKLVTLSADDLLLLGHDKATAFLGSLPSGQVPLEQRTPARLSAASVIAGRADADEVLAFQMLGLEHPSQKKNQ